MNRLIVFILAIVSSAAAHGQVCSAYTDQRLVSIVDSIALIAERVSDAEGPGHTSREEGLAEIRAILNERDPVVNRELCSLLDRLPSLEFALADIARQLDQPEMQSWLSQSIDAQRSLPRNFPCLDDRQYEATRSILSVLRIVHALLQGYCDGTSCFDGACNTPCLLLNVFGALQKPFEFGLALNGLYCSTQHANDMKQFCAVFGPGICAGGRASGSTLIDIENLVTNDILPRVAEADQDVATRETLDSTKNLLADRVLRTQDQIRELELLIDEDSERRRRFQEDLRSISIEAALSGPADSAPIDLQLPVAVGGRLEVVREIVADAIANSLQAGLKTGEALSYLRQGDDDLNAGLYANAFQSYRNAYRELVE